MMLCGNGMLRRDGEVFHAGRVYFPAGVGGVPGNVRRL